MKVFWSWQSNTPGNIGRHFIRGVLEDALAQLKAGDDLDEPAREDLHLDHDRKGVPGSPDLAKAILEKVRNSVVFVADVTPVGKTDDGKPLINSNVAIELGYALPVVGDDGLLMVFNEAYGVRESLPFNLRHKAGPITYNLPPDASKEQIGKARALLVGSFKTALRDCLEAKRASIGISPQDLHDEVLTTGSCAEYWEPGDALVRRQMTGAKYDVLRYATTALIYLRVIPKVAMEALREAEIADLIYGIKVPPLNSHASDGACHGRNKYGGMTFSFAVEDGRGILLTSTQIFRNRELWGIDSTLLNEKKLIPSGAYERVLSSGLQSYIIFAEERMEYKCPLIIEAGAAGVEGYHMAMGPNYNNRNWGPITFPEIRSRHELVDTNQKSVNSVLLKIFEDFFDAVGAHRPDGFNGFPSK